MATPVARDASRRAVEQGEKEAPLAMLLSLSLVPSLSRSAALPLSFFPATAPNPNRACRRHCRSSEPPQTNRLEQKQRLVVLYFLFEARKPGSSTSPGFFDLPQIPRPEFAVDFVAAVASPTSPTAPFASW